MTIKDVAKEAGVSIASVSRVLNKHPIRQDTRERVEEAIKKLNYIPNALAQGLMQKRTKTIGALITSMTNTYYMEITEVIEKSLWNKNFMLFLCTTDGEHKQELEYLEGLVSRQVDGIIIIDPSIENYRNGLYDRISQQMPLVLIHSFPEIKGHNSVFIDQESGMIKVMEYLWGIGHRKIAFLRGHHGYSFDIKETCWHNFLAEKESAPDPENLIVISGGNTDNAIGLAMDACVRILSASPEKRPTAIFACNDLMALGAVAAAHSLGIRIPQELSVIGHDNTNLTQSSMPPLSSVNMKLSNLGHAALDLLDHALNPEYPGAERILVEPELIIRGSSSPVVSP